MRIRFWGTRGSLAKPGPSTIRYGGNTSCVEVRAADVVQRDLVEVDALMAAERQKRSDSELNRTVGTYAKILGLSDEQSQALRSAMVDARARRHELARAHRHDRRPLLHK